MATTLKEKMATLAPDRRERIEVETERLHREYLTLRQLRKAKELTQTQVAETLGVRQSTVAKMERRGDLMISTLRGYVEAMGGRLELIVEFPGSAAVHLDGLGDVEEPAPPTKTAPRSAQLDR